MDAHRVHRPLHVACNKVDQNNRLLKVLFSGGIGGKCTCSDVFDGSVYLSPMMAPAEKFRDSLERIISFVGLYLAVKY